MEGQGLLEMSVGAIGAILISVYEIIGSYWWLPALTLIMSLFWIMGWKFCQRKKRN